MKTKINEKTFKLLNKAMGITPCHVCKHHIGELITALKNGDEKTIKRVGFETNLAVRGSKFAKPLGYFVFSISESDRKWWIDTKSGFKAVYPILKSAYAVCPNSATKSMMILGKFRANNTLKEHIAFVRLMKLYFSLVHLSKRVRGVEKHPTGLHPNK
jgi:hypothetical protein